MISELNYLLGPSVVSGQWSAVYSGDAPSFVLAHMAKRKLAEESREGLPEAYPEVICTACGGEFSLEEWIQCGTCVECHHCCECASPVPSPPEAPLAPLDSDDDFEGPRCVIPPPPPGTACQCSEHVSRRGRPCPGRLVQPYHDNMVFGAMTAGAVPHVVYLCAECCQSRADRLLAGEDPDGDSGSDGEDGECRECYCLADC